MSNVLFILLSCGLLTFFLTWFLSTRQHWLPDISNHRSSHEGSVPRSGGVAFFLAYLVFQFVFSDWFLLPQGLWQPLLFLLLVSLIDDFRHIPAIVRLLVHFLAIGWSLWLIAPDASVLNYVVLLFLGVWAINLTNFMDGSDGFAGSMAIVFFASMSLILYLAGVPEYVLWLLICAALLGFLPLNWPKASIFMGDMGSTGIGYLIWLACVLAIVMADINPLVPLVLFSPSWVDASVTLLYRAMKKEKIWRAHRKHSYQRLIRLGFSHRKLLICELLLMLFCAVIALLIQLMDKQPVSWFMLLALMFFYITVIITIFKRSEHLITNDPI